MTPHPRPYQAPAEGCGAEIVYGLDDLMTQPVNGSGCNEQYGLLGSNKSNEDTVKLFPVPARVWWRTSRHRCWPRLAPMWK